MKTADRWLVCGNRLLDGRAVYAACTLGEDWVTDPARACVRSKAEAEAEAAAAPPHLIAGAEAVAIDAAGALLRRRERIRAAGPTVRTDLGRQAEEIERS